MAITFVQAKGGTHTTFNGATSFNVVLGATPTNGNLLVAWHVADNPTVGATNTPSGWTSLGDVTQSSGSGLRATMFYKVVSGDSATISFSIASGVTNMVAMVCEYAPGGGTWSLLTENGEAEASANSYTTPAVDPTDGVITVTVCAGGIDTDNVVASNHRVNGSTAGVGARVTQVNARNDASGTTGSMWDLIEAASVSGSYSGSVDWSTTNVGCSQIAIFQAVPAGGKGLPVIAHWHNEMFR